MTDVPNDIDLLHDELVELREYLEDISAAQAAGSASIAIELTQRAKNKLNAIINSFYEEVEEDGDEDNT